MNTKRVKIAVFVDCEGNWQAFGHYDNTDLSVWVLQDDVQDWTPDVTGVPFHIVEADVPIPDCPTKNHIPRVHEQSILGDVKEPYRIKAVYEELETLRTRIAELTGQIQCIETPSKRNHDLP